MSSVTRCKPAVERPSALPSSAVTQVVISLLIVLGFGLAQIHLRVRLSDVRRDIGALQADQTRLMSDITSVRTENESLKNLRNLRVYASRELGMVSSDPTNHDSITIPEDIQTRYALARAIGGDAPGASGGSEMAQTDRNAPALASLGERIGLVGAAQADETTR